MQVTNKILGNTEIPDANMVSVVTTVVEVETDTATFELETLTEYKNLRQSITITTTTAIATSTAPGKSGIETAIAVVLAGGVVWFLAGK